jgi:hypothetical protein
MRNGAITFPELYRKAWLKARAKRPGHRALSDEFLWHDVYDLYAEKLPRLTADAESVIIRLWQEHGSEDHRAKLLEAFYYIVRPIAGQIATKRFPPPLKMTRVAYDGQRDRIHELASVGTLGLFVAANRFNPALGYRFSTNANRWVRKYIQLYCEEIVGVVPRTGHRGPDPNCPGLDLPRLSVMDRIEAAIEGRRLYRGKAAGGMAVFDAGFFIDGIETPEGGKLPNFEYLSTEGPTREYLQRRVGVGGARFVWPKQVSREVIAPWVPADRPTDLIELPRKPVERKFAFSPVITGDGITAHGGGELLFLYGPRMVVLPTTDIYDKDAFERRRRETPRGGRFNSRDKFGEVTTWPKPEPQLTPKYRTPSWRNGKVIAFEYLRRSALRKETENEIEILRRADAVQITAGVSRRRRRRRAEAYDLPQRILPASLAREAGA